MRSDRTSLRPGSQVDRGTSDNRPVVAVLVTRWEAGSEEGWTTRQVAGALACSANVHIITPNGTIPAQSVDSVFTVHELATPVDPTAELRRDLLLDAFSATATVAVDGRRGVVPSGLDPLLDGNLLQSWHGAIDILHRIRPDLVVIADYRNIGALDAVERAAPGVPVTLLALGADLAGLASSHFDRLIDRSSAVLAITETERVAMRQHHRGANVHRIGIPAAANPSVLREPNTWVGETEYVLVITGADTKGKEEEVALSRMLRLRFPDNPVGIAATDAFSVWHQGRLSQGWPVERSSDMARLMAWARVTVDLRPGSLVARRCVESLLYGTPIIVPEDTRAKEHAELGRGGLWFSSPGELVWCVEAMLDNGTRHALGSQGSSYAEQRYGSTDAFIERVLTATNLIGLPGSDRLTA